MGFAIPVDTVNQYVPQLIRNGAIERPGLGVVLAPTPMLLELRRLGRIPDVGVLVREVPPNTSAARAGLQGVTVEGEQLVLGDLIVAVDGVVVRRNEELSELIQKHAIGEAVVLTIVRGGQRQDVPVELQDLSAL